MAVVWERAPVAASAIVEALHEREQWTLATVRTLLRRLVNKGALAQEVEGKRYLYRPLILMETCTPGKRIVLGPCVGPRALGRHPSPRAAGGVNERGHRGASARFAGQGAII